MGTLMGVDLGTSSVKTMLLSEKGQVLASAGASYDVSIPKMILSCIVLFSPIIFIFTSEFSILFTPSF